eukprot:TRINITY_DN2377_c0_g1_i1.p1 TRINITY_DN2377_c0_g1~~TRINITY_DN2377_c0_g1_i1.p1  ORF type:complete len:351 (-),score=74.85 TRINITY_DN2377_c0_g1_i1:59-1111(-)
MLRFLDKYFSEFGRDSLEFEGSCNSSTFFSWYRHEGTWSKCETCQHSLADLLVDQEDDEHKNEVKLHSFAKFCGENLLLAIRDLILSAHPASSSHSRFQIIAPDLHLFNEDNSNDVDMRLQEGEDIKDPEGLEHNQMVFVGQSDHLAELHHSICRQVLHKTVDRIDSVKDLSEFVDWMNDNADGIAAQKGKILIVVDCQSEIAHSSEGRPTSDELCCDHSEALLLAEKVCRCLRMKKALGVGVALLTCPFLIHEAGQVQRLQENLLKLPFARQLISSDCRKMTEFVGNMMSPSAVKSSTDDVRKEEDEVTSKGKSRFAVSDLAGDVVDDLAADMVLMKKSKKSKKGNKAQ